MEGKPLGDDVLIKGGVHLCPGPLYLGFPPRAARVGPLVLPIDPWKQAALDALRGEGYSVQEEDLVHLWPTRFAHIHCCGKYEFNVAEAKARKGLRPLTA